jgi:Mg-chelatase subunit ChlD
MESRGRYAQCSERGGDGRGPQKKGSTGRVLVVVITDGRCNVSLHDSGDADLFAG